MFSVNPIPVFQANLDDNPPKHKSCMTTQFGSVAFKGCVFDKENEVEGIYFTFGLLGVASEIASSICTVNRRVKLVPLQLDRLWLLQSLVFAFLCSCF